MKEQLKFDPVAKDYTLKKSLGPLMIWGLGVGYVISGMYFGWNLGLKEGGFGIFLAIPFAMWFFLAIEGIANIAEEAKNPQKDIAVGFRSAMFTLAGRLEQRKSLTSKG